MDLYVLGAEVEEKGRATRVDADAHRVDGRRRRGRKGIVLDVKDSR